MQVAIDVPQAFSVRDENEFHAHQHLMARLNSELRVTPVMTGVHVRGGCTVFWGLVHLKAQTISKEQLQVALEEAGFDTEHNQEIPPAVLAEINQSVR